MCKLVKNTIFAEKTFADCSLLQPKVATPPNFAEKTFANSHKIAKFAKVFSLESFPLYGSYQRYLYPHLIMKREKITDFKIR